MIKRAIGNLRQGEAVNDSLVSWIPDRVLFLVSAFVLETWAKTRAK